MGFNSKPVGSVKRILIVGLLPRQFETVQRRIGDRAVLEHCSSQDGIGRIMQALHSGAYAVVNTKFIYHRTLHHVDRDRCRLCHGGDTTVTREVEALL
ncbi:MAG: hypothetical protein ACXWBT_14395 [Usitatibacter sp.]